MPKSTAGAMRWNISNTRKLNRLGVVPGRIAELKDEADRAAYEAEVKLAEASLVDVRMNDGRLFRLPVYLEPQVVGLDARDYLVIRAWQNKDGSDYNVALTPCCYANASVDEEGAFYCKACYGGADAYFGAEADPVVTPRLADPSPAAMVAEARKQSRKSTPAEVQFEALGLTDPAAYTPAMNLALKQRWTNLPVDVKSDDLRAQIAAVTTAVTSTAAVLQAQGFGDEDACKTEAARLSRNAKVNAWRARNQLQAALDARTLRYNRRSAKAAA